MGSGCYHASPPASPFASLAGTLPAEKRNPKKYYLNKNTTKKGKITGTHSPQHSLPVRPGLQCRHDTIILIGIHPDFLIRKGHVERLIVVLDLYRYTR